MNRRFVALLLGAVVACLADDRTVSADQSPGSQPAAARIAPSPKTAQPAAGARSPTPSFTQGGKAVVVRDGVKLMFSGQAIAVLARGTEMAVGNIGRGWIAGYVMVGDERKAGYVDTGDLAPVPPAPSRDVREHGTALDRLPAGAARGITLNPPPIVPRASRPQGTTGAAPAPCPCSK